MWGGRLAEERDVEPERRCHRLDRRAAMKAALAGAAAAAVWQVPRIEGLSVAPDVAQAATCAPSSDTESITGESRLPGALWCWGAVNIVSGCEPGDTTNLTAGIFSATAVLSGEWDNSVTNGTLVFTPTSINVPSRVCTVNLNVDCPIDRNPVPLGGVTTTFNTNAAQTITGWGCRGVPPILIETATVQLSFECACT
jgi:hypothetical protein